MSKSTLLTCAVLCLRLIIAEPHDHPRHQHKPRVAAVGHDVADVIVYVNEQNVPVSTATVFRDLSLSTEPLVQQTVAATRPFNAVPSDTVQSGSGGIDTKGGFSIGVTYSPYNSDHSCKDGAAVAHDLANLGDYKVVRLYGTDCNQVANVAKALGGKTSLFAGIFDIKNIDKEVDLIHSGINGDWKTVNAVSVGNELVNSGQATADQVTSAIDAAKSALKAKGYTGPVTTVDTMMAHQNNPKLCQASDFCAINCHAFFDGNVGPSDAGKFVSGWAQKISAAAGNKRVVVTETGWPTQGSANGVAQPGRAQQQQAISSIKQAVGKDLILFTLYNDLWKQDRSDTFHAERFWGLTG